MSKILPVSGGGFIAKVTASASGCPWTTSSPTATFTPPSGTSTGTAPFNVTVSVPTNPDVFSRLLFLTIAEQTLVVNQGGQGCSLTLSEQDAPFSAAGGERSVGVTTPVGCTYETVLGPSWISVTSGASGNGDGTLVYTVDQNSTTAPRSGSLTIGGQTLQITPGRPDVQHHAQHLRSRQSVRIRPGHGLDRDCHQRTELRLERVERRAVGDDHALIGCW